jgi:hypothetical protein
VKHPGMGDGGGATKHRIKLSTPHIKLSTPDKLSTPHIKLSTPSRYQPYDHFQYHLLVQILQLPLGQRQLRHRGVAVRVAL